MKEMANVINLMLFVHKQGNEKLKLKIKRNARSCPVQISTYSTSNS